MKILNPKLIADLEKGHPVKLDLGSGGIVREGFYSVDHIELEGVDVVADLNKPLELFPDNSVDYIYSRHVLEHINELLPLMREIHRITKKNGIIEVIVPHFSNVLAFSDPTHVRFFGLYSMYYFVAPENQPKIRKVPAFYTDVRFQINSIKIEFYRTSIFDKILYPFFSTLLNSNTYFQNIYERLLSGFFHAWQIRYIMQVEK
ncbi:MAG: class I SAM-dependent methyltransferase [Bacteroidota bacterium]